MSFQKVFFLCFVFAISSCTSQGDKEVGDTNKNVKTYPEVFTKVLDAHGGKSTWDAMNTFLFTKGKAEKAEYHTIDLKTRRSTIEVKNKYVLGFDGTDVWVSPHRDSFPGKSPRFTHNLHFYFAAVPFVFTDPGVNVKDGGKVISGDKEYLLLNVTFDNNVGDAPEDQYNMYVDPSTYRVDFITYSVTYFDTSRATQYNALRYDWADANGIIAPTGYVGYKWENNSLGDQRYEAELSDVMYKKLKKPDAAFSVPKGAFVDK